MSNYTPDIEKNKKSSLKALDLLVNLLFCDIVTSPPSPLQFLERGNFSFPLHVMGRVRVG